MAAKKSYFNSRVEKEFFKPIYSASIGDELEDGLFDGINIRKHEMETIFSFSFVFLNP